MSDAAIWFGLGFVCCLIPSLLLVATTYREAASLLNTSLAYAELRSELEEELREEIRENNA
jgi:hypothetical protein